MAGRKQDKLVDRLSTRIAEEVERSSTLLAGKIDAELLDDTQRVSEPEFLQFVRQHWPDPQWRLGMLERMGPHAFYEASMKAWGVPTPEPVSRLVRDGQAKGYGQPPETPPLEVPPGPQAPPIGAPLAPPAPPEHVAMARNGVARATDLEPPGAQGAEY